MNLLALLFLTILVSCNPFVAPSNTNFAYDYSNPISQGPLNAMSVGDSREEVTKFEHSLAAFGMIQNPTGICSSVLVAQDIVLTNAHCVVRVLNNKRKLYKTQDISFFLNYTKGNSTFVSVAKELIVPKEFLNGMNNYDYAFIRLENASGDNAAIMPVVPMDKKYFNKTLIKTVGYDIEHPLTKTIGLIPLISGEYCFIGKIENGFMQHSCPTGHGSSGGPILTEIDGEMKLIGINEAQSNNQSKCTGFIPDVCFNQGISSNQFYTLYKKLTTI